MDTKSYVLIAGKHHKDGKTYIKGDSIELTEEEAKGLANKIADPSSLGISNDIVALQVENQTLKEKVAELEAENEQLKADLEAFEEED
jgi:cell division protein FtsB